ncbi:MAG: Na+/H+ antiporter subunit E [Proteobacteria bacterium]|jgi:multicomponent Na+:H+ antiporter subunit E|nr:Na+/H+ antiporter subunit E [Pseudomonadota bacterium]MDA1299335.1 Na+/H+ antiporter subunit E [Pseudomonadota bacterium]
MRAEIAAIALTTVALSSLWIALSGYFNTLQLCLGAISVVFVVWLSARLDLLVNELRPSLLLGLPRYHAWLAWQVIKSNFQVAAIILAPRSRMRRTVLRMLVKQQTAVGIATYANSITLTPGTVTLDAEGDELIVHVLGRKRDANVLGMEMHDRIARIEGSL